MYKILQTQPMLYLTKYSYFSFEFKNVNFNSL